MRTRRPIRPERDEARAPRPSAFNLVLDPSGRTTLAPVDRPSAGFQGEHIRLAAEAPVVTPVSRTTKRMRAAGALSVVAAETIAGTALEFSSSAGQAMGALLFGTIAYFGGMPAFKKAWREATPKHQSTLTAEERSRGE